LNFPAVVVKIENRCKRSQRKNNGANLTEEKILTLHPQGKQGVRIHRKKYDLMRETVLSCLQGGEMTHKQLFAEVEERLKGRFEGSIPWYAETVKLDLEARGEIERVAGLNLQRYRLK
jgi:hypothetical protein